MEPEAPAGAPIAGPPPDPRGRLAVPALLATGAIVLGAVLVAVTLLSGVLGGSTATPSASGAVAATPLASSVPTAPPIASASAGPAPTASPVPSPVGPVAGSGTIAVLRPNGSLAFVEADGRATPVGDVGAVYGFPAWSPDGSRIAVVRTDAVDTSIVIIDPERVSLGLPFAPLPIFRSTTVGPFYLYWSPDGREVSFLANESGDISLRVAPADGSAPLDGSGPGALVRSGNPFYYDWLAEDAVLAHVGVGSDAFLGPLGLDGDAAGRPFASPGDFRSAVVSPDRASIAWIRAAAEGPDDVVVSARDGSDEQVMPVFGPAAVLWSPTGDLVGAIGPSAPPARAYTIPAGPLRVMDPGNGDVRELLDGFVISFWWSPDARTIAALRVVPAEQTSETEARIVFVDVESGRILSDPRISPGQRYIDAFLGYFDQYALSHHVWAPDGSAFLTSEIDADGVPHLTLLHPDGDDPIELQGEIGFWSP